MVDELRQDDGLPGGTKVVPIVAAVSPLGIIVQEGSHRQNAILRNTAVAATPVTQLRKTRLRTKLTKIDHFISYHRNIRVRISCQEKNARPGEAAGFVSRDPAGGTVDPFQGLAESAEHPLPP
jgi:hypothetical protein